MSMQLLNEISDNYQMAVAVHRELADVFWFVSLPGYALWNEYQRLDEGMTQRKIKRYIATTYHEFVPDKLPKSANISDALLGSKNRKELKMDDTWKIIQEAFRVYQKWEEFSLEKYQKAAAELLANGDVSAFGFVSEIIKDVKAELVFLTDKIIELSAHNWDMPQIVAEQPEYFERYERLIRESMGKGKFYHHHNSAIDAQSRAIFEKSPD